MSKTNHGVVLVGRPNVGKSTLFNRLTHQQQAITSPVEGVTRDRQYGQVYWKDRSFTLIDTGGYLEDDLDSWSPQIREQVHAALSEARLILLVGDCKQGCQPTDKALAHVLRKIAATVLVVANKADTEALSLMSASFYDLGFESVYPVSASHGTGKEALLQAITELLPPKAPLVAPENKRPAMAIIGQPNVGKSSLLNVLLGESRSLVSETAGTTRDALHVDYHRFDKEVTLIDTAGMRKRNKNYDDIEFYAVLRALRALESCDVAWVMIDASAGLQRQDLHLLHTAQDMGKGVLLVINKWDLIEKDHRTAQEWTRQLHAQLGNLRHIPLVFCSVLTKQRLLRLLEEGLVIYERKKRHISTSVLNTWLQKQKLRYTPVLKGGRRLNVSYITQVASAYPCFVVFANHVEVPTSYERYLVNQLRKEFGFQGVKVAVHFKKKR